MVEKTDPGAIYLKDYQPPAYFIDTVDLIFYLYPGSTRVRSKLAVHRNPESKETSTLKLMGEGLTPVWVRLNGSELSAGDYQIDDESLSISNPPESFVLETEVEIEPEKNTLLEGLYQSGNMYCTQCEAEGFRRITWFLDRPDVMACFSVRIEADKQRYPVLLSNGNLLESGALPAGRHFATWEDPFPKPCYLFALVAGDLSYIEDQHATPSGKQVQLRIYVEPENSDKCEHAMRSLIKAMVWDEQKYGREYDLDVYNIVAVNDFNAGAMENKGLNIFNSKYVLARQETATDQDFQGIESVVAHEYFHNWTGNRITCRDWFQLSLKEGFTVYRDQEFSADMGDRGVKRIEDVRHLRSAQFAEDAGPMAHPVRPASYIAINNFYTLTVYEKGAEVVRMQANFLGAEQFRQATDRYFQRFDGQAVTTDDFVQCMADTSGRDMTQFKRWYDYAGTPNLHAEGHYDEQAQTWTLKVSQQVPDTAGQEDKPPFHIPLAVGLLDADGNDLPLKKQAMLELTEAEQSFVFEGVNSEPVPSLLRGFSAPVKMEYAYTDEQLMFLMAHDSDGFNRWDAAQTLAQRLILDLVEKHQAGKTVEVNEGFINAFRNALQSDAEPALLAEVLMLPAESYLGDQMAIVDVDAIHSARVSVKQVIARELEALLFDTYERLQDKGEYQITQQAIGQRSLKNLLLSYLLAGGSEKAKKVCLAQYHAEHNMTDVMAALALIADSDLAERQDVLDDFSDRWQHDPLVMDKWFIVQALSSREDTLTSVQALCAHESFSIKNPNKVYSLIGRFTANPVRFHTADGGGYRFLVDRVLELNELNPQVAARMLRGMARWQRYDEGRQKLMRAQLERIVSAEGISSNVFEVASVSLGK